MMNEDKTNTDNFFEEVIKKTKTGITFPKELRAILFEGEKDVFFKLIVPNEKNKIILEFINEEEANIISEKVKEPKSKQNKSTKPSSSEGTQKVVDFGPNWGAYFVYDFKNQEKVRPILESAFYKFSEKPPNLEDAMGRVKYVLISFLSSTKTENAKLYFSVIRFLSDIIERFDQPNLIDWIFEKIIPNIESKFLYEQALLELLELSLKVNRYEKAELFIFYILKNIDEYPRSELYNIFNSFKELVKKVRNVDRTEKIDILLKEKLLEYGEGINDVDYKIQIVEFLEDLNYVEFAYRLAKEIQTGLPADSIKVEEIRKIVKRLYIAPITENKKE